MDYNPLPPDQYPISWNTGAKQSLSQAGAWVSVVYAATQTSAIARMRRLRAFHKGLRQYPGFSPELSQALLGGKTMEFRKLPFQSGWDIQLRVVEATVFPRFSLKDTMDSD